MLSYLRRMDWALNGCIAVLGIMGMLAIASARPHNAAQQGIWFALGIAVFIAFSCINWRPLVNYRWIIFAIYMASVALLVATYFFAPSIRGTKSWLVFGPVQFQASETVKAALIILYSYYFSHRHVGIAHARNIIIPLLYALIPVGLILLQPDMGSAVIVGGLWVIYILVSGIRWRHIVIGLMIATALGFFGWNSALEGYQRERIKGLFNPQYDPLGVNYNVIQSKIAIGSGGLLGKGWKRGTQVQLGFLPEAANDFVFATVVEEWGLAGGALVLFSFLGLIIRTLIIGVRAENNFSKLVCLGTSGLFLLHALFNIGSAVGLMPVVGIPFPLLSYGGSSPFTSFMLLGIAPRISIRPLF